MRKYENQENTQFNTKLLNCIPLGGLLYCAQVRNEAAGLQNSTTSAAAGGIDCTAQMQCAACGHEIIGCDSGAIPRAKQKI